MDRQKGVRILKKIHSAVIHLDDDMPEYMDGMIRIGSVSFFDEDGEEIENTSLSNQFVNIESHEDNPEKLIKYVAKTLGIDESNVEIE